MNCPRCKTPVESHDIYCSQCGYRLSSAKKCPQCHAIVESDSIYCNECGSKIIQDMGKQNQQEEGFLQRFTFWKVLFGVYVGIIVTISLILHDMTWLLLSFPLFIIGGIIARILYRLMAGKYDIGEEAVSGAAAATALYLAYKAVKKENEQKK